MILEDGPLISYLKLRFMWVGLTNLCLHIDTTRRNSTISKLIAEDSKLIEHWGVALNGITKKVTNTKKIYEKITLYLFKV